MRALLVSTVVLTGVVSACSGFSTADDGAPAAPAAGDAGADADLLNGQTDKSFSAGVPAKVTMIQGRSTAVHVEFKRSTFIVQNGVVIRASLAAPPAGFSAAPLPVGPGEMTADFMVDVAADVAQGDYTLDVELKADSGFTLEKKIPVFVRGPAGSIDTTFGVNGYMRSFFGTGPQALIMKLFAVANDRFVAVGQCTGNGTMCMARFDASGKLDPTYGTNGLFSTDKVFADNAVLLASGGLMLISSGTHCRVLANGSIDAAYGSGGCSNTNPTTSFAGIAAAGPDGSLYLVTNTSGPITIAKVTPAGADDTSFGSGGTATVSFPGTGGTITDLIVRNDGSIVVTGHSGNVGRVILRLDGTTGAPIGSAATATQTTTAGGLVELKDGRLVILGEVGSTSVYVAGFHADLTVDTTFGTGGATSPALDKPTAIGTVLGVMSDGRFVTVTDNRELVRFTAMGNADTSLAPDSVVPIALDDTPIAAGMPWVLTSDDRIILGFSQKLQPTTYDLLMVGVWN